ncbi:fimbria/pilus periplasmic chaperone, partial [Enterobacter kobei]|uniref:fimbria/pilus periplasmic chaperone n=2 Tax=Enterobacteriaceae TaxID=543 RepID=UPI002A7FD716
LFRLEKEQQSRLRIIRTGGTFSEDKETLQWICVKGIPPKEGDAWLEDKDGNSPKPGNMANLKVQISISNCIKLFIRPSKLKGNSFDVASSVIWSKNNDKLEIKNPTPFYMNISSVMVDGSVVNGVEFVAPFSSRSFDLPNKSPKKVQWKIIGDHGGESMPFYSEL